MNKKRNNRRGRKNQRKSNENDNERFFDRKWRKSLRRKWRKYWRYHRWSDWNNEEEQDSELEEQKDLHPELKHLNHSRHYHYRRRPHISKRMIEKANSEQATKIIIFSAILFSILNLAIGIMNILSLIGIRENHTWAFYTKLRFFGWEGQAMTGIVNIIITLVIIWSLVYFFKNETQKGDSYLIIGIGLSMLFGYIYVLIVVADVISGLLAAWENLTPIAIETYFYTPIVLAIIAFPLFRWLMIRHKMFIPFESRNNTMKNEQQNQ
jgi:hypothetical protein